MSCERTRRAWGWLAGLLAVTALMSVPASGMAAEPVSAAHELSAAGTLARGAGYGSRTGIQPVRELQRRLRRLGNGPGPVDGLYGPLTEGAVQRFQQAHELAADGVVGTQTKTRLLARGAERQVADTSRPTHTGQSSRKSPAGSSPAESAIDPNAARIAPSETLSRAGPPSSRGLSPEIVALLAALAAAALLLAVRTYGRRVREARVSFGMVCAALLAVFVAGAVIGAVFATHAARDAGGHASADSGALLAARGAPRHRSVAEVREQGRAARQVQRTPAARAPSPRPASPARVARPPAQVARPVRRRSPAAVDDRAAAPLASAAPPEGQAVVQRPPGAPARPSASTYTVRPGDALWPIAERHLAPSSSVARVARKVESLESLNVDRIASGDPDMLEAGEELRLR
jgi:peptidoglycan hydrolase-like protein with peptidoglycan-binding domain